MRRSTIIALLAAVAVAPATASARVPAPPPPVWATVNVCDTTAHPNQMGVRGSMPGLAKRSRMYMRFRVQFRNGEGKWRLLKSGPLSDSGWVRVAIARKGDHDAGWSFEFRPPTTGGAHVLRGLVQFEWRRGSKVVQRTKATTTDGHPGTAGAEPEDYSAAMCEIA